jgi:hypothetical protein
MWVASNKKIPRKWENVVFDQIFSNSKFASLLREKLAFEPILEIIACVCTYVPSVLHMYVHTYMCDCNS